MMARALPLLALLLADAALAQDCSTAEMMSVQEIVTTCCESAVDGGDCGTVFPATCSHSCARLVVPYIDSCGTMLRALPDEAFPGLHIAGCAIITQLSNLDRILSTALHHELQMSRAPCGDGSLPP